MNERKLSQIRALLDTAESYAETHPAAAENYRNKAISLMAAYGVEESVLSAQTHPDEKPISRTLDIANPYRVDKMLLVYKIAQVFGAEAIRGNATITLVGFESDLDKIEVLFTSLLVQAFSELAHADKPHYVATVTFNKSWLTGFSSRIQERLGRAYRQAAQEHESTGTELVLADRSARVQAEFKVLYPKTTTTKRRVSTVGAGQGRAAADRADLGQKRTHGRAALPA